MYPTLHDVAAWLPRFDTHSFFVAVGMAAGVAVFMVEKRRRNMRDERLLYIVLGAVVGAALMARLGTWAQHLDPTQNLSVIDQLARGNASILSALLGAWVGAHVAKRVTRYPGSTGDLFAPAVALAMAIGRFACFFTERPGTPTGASWGVILDAPAAAYTQSPAGVPLHPSFLYEVAFHAVAFCLLWFWLRRAPIAQGQLLTLYIAAYGVFRFGVEFVRGNEVVWEGLTRPQLFLLVTVPLLLVRIAWLARSGRLVVRGGQRQVA
ncbi:prolipoprotein diacylglyceryl transferase [Micrococcales bacterium 31B]|nr:prolipoprotein diacylglyceryl transferase [Micrococcales bacterium 31B]